MDAVVLVDVVVGILTGIVAGITAGLFGVGGGVIMVPVLHYGLGLPFPLATAVSLFVITFNTPFGLWKQHLHGNVHWRHGALLTLGGALGVAMGWLVQPFIPVTALKLGFAAVMLFASYRMVTGARHEAPERPHGVAWLIPGGFVAGVAAHLFGIGGGLLMVPVLVLLGIGVHVAVATSLVAVFTNAAVSTATSVPVLVHELGLAIPLMLGAIIGIRLGVRMANALPATRLRHHFGVFLGIMALLMVAEAIGIIG